MKRIVVIGGGISGLAAAHRLLELAKSGGRSIEVTLLEANDHLGGIVHTTERDGFLIERGPDSFISEKPEAVALAKRLGIEGRLVETNEVHRRSFIVRNGRLRPVPEGFQLLAPSRFWPFITTDIFSIPGKFRMAADLLLPRANANGSSDESLASFVRRRLGQEALDRMAQPMVGGIYTADPEKLSLSATLPRFLEMEREHRSVILAMWRKRRGQKPGVSGARYSLFLSFDRGMQVLTDELARRVSDSADVRINTCVSAVLKAGQAWEIRTANGEGFGADAVCVALPAYRAADLLEHVDNKLSGSLRQLRYASTSTLNLAYNRADIKHPLDGFGFVVPYVERRSLLACTFSSVKFANRAPQGHVLLRAFVGGALQPELFEKETGDIVALVKHDLKELLGISNEPLFVETTKWANSMPQYQVGHLDLVDKIEHQLNDLPTIAVAGNSYRGAGIPDCIRSGEAAAERLLN